VDDDGDLDLFVVDLAGPSRLFENTIGNRRSWIRIHPRPGPDRRTVLGTRVSVTTGGRTQTRELQVSPSYASGSLTDLHFGLGGAERVEVEVRWPDGQTERLGEIDARRVYRLTRADGLQPRPPPTAQR
jgi:enediyne biosynthesis protein E4